MASKDESRVGKHRTRFNSMTSIWYGLIIGTLQAYLIVQNVRRFVHLAELPWPYPKTPFIELNVYIALTGVAVLLLPFFLASCILQVGNSSNDNRMLGKHLGSRDEWSTHLVPGMLYQRTSSFFRTIWTHSGPTSSLVHVISSFCLLLPHTLMEAVLIKNGFSTQGCVWRTDLEVLMSQSERNEVLEILSRSSVPSSKVGGSDGLMGCIPRSQPMENFSPELMRPEFVNYAIALIIFSVRYANVFWHANKTFSILFCFQLMVNSIHSLISFSCFSVLYKIHVVGPTQIFQKDLPLLLNNHVTVLLYIISVTILLLSSSVLYHYGYGKISSFVKHAARTQYVTNGDDINGYGVGWAYFPHCSALAVLLALASTQSPLVHDATIVYGYSLDKVMLANIISAATHMLLWMVLWLNLTARRNWTFHVDVNIGKLRVKGLEALRLSADIALSLPDGPNTPLTPMSSAMLVVNESQAFAVTDLNSKKSILGVLLRTAQMKRDGESDERIYWPRRSPVAGTQNSLEDDEQPWLHETKETTASPCRNKVTFNDELPSPRKYASVPLPRMGGLKRTCRDRSFNQLSQGEVDDGDYAMLRGGRSVLTNKNHLASDGDYEEHQELLALVNASGEHHPPVVTVQHCNNPLNSGTRETTSVAQGTPRSVQSSTDSGYNGRSGSVTRSDSRSTSSSASPPDRTASESSSSGVHSTCSPNKLAVGNPPPQNQQGTNGNCHCEGQQCYVEHSLYGQIGLSRRNSIKSPTHPIYEASATHGKIPPCSIYESRIVPVPAVLAPPSVSESLYGENLNSSKLVNLTTNLGASAGREKETVPTYNHVNQWKSCSLSRSQCPTPDYTSNTVKSNEHESKDGTLMEKVENNEGVMIRRKPSLTRPKTTDMSQVIQSTPFGRCTNMKNMSSFVDQTMPPIPPPLPPLSFVLNGPHSTIPTASVNSRHLSSRSGSFRSPNVINHSPANYSAAPSYPRHSTIPNQFQHSGISNGDILSTFHSSINSPNPNQVNTYPMIQSSPHYSMSPPSCSPHHHQRN